MSKQAVVDYYNQSEIDYRLIWHLDSEMAMHYGFWGKGVNNLKQALQRENQVLADIARIKKDEMVLDAGCGVGGSAIYLAGSAWLLYTYFFVVAKDAFWYSIFLTLGGLFAVKVFLGLYERLKNVDAGFAKTFMVLGMAGALGAMLHGGYDLANVINPPTGANPSLPSQIDPRGLLTFGITGLAVLKASYLGKGAKNFPKNLAYLGWF